MSWRGTVLLSLLAVLAISFFLFSGRSRTRSALEPLLGLTPNLADRIVIQESGGTVQLLKNEGVWYLQGTLADRADPHLVAALLNAAASITPLDVLKPHDLRGDVSLSSLELRKPKRSLAIRAGSTHTLWLGIDGAAKGQLYAKLDSGSAVYLIPSEVVPMAFRPIEEFRDPRLTALAANHLEEASLTRSENLQQLLLRKDIHGWNLVNPVAAKGDQNAITGWLDSLLGARIQQWMPADTDPSSCGMDSPTAVVIVKEEDATNNPVTITIGSPVPDSPGNYYARCSDRPGICTIAGAGTFLATTPQSLRSLKLQPVDYDTIDRIEIGSGAIESTPLVLARKPGGEDWEIKALTQTTGPTIPGDTVRAWFDKIQQLSAQGFEPATPERLQLHGLDHPDHIRFIAHLSENTAEEGAGEMVLADYAFGTPTGGVLALRVGDSTDLMIFPEGTLDLLRNEPANWSNPSHGTTLQPSPAVTNPTASPNSAPH